MAPGEDGMAEVLARAVAAGVITPEQAEAILALEPGRPTRRVRVPPALEALGYLGGIFVLVGAVALVSGFWEDLATWSRLAVLGVAAGALTGAGLLVDEDEPVLWRLRGFVLLLGSGAVCGFSALLAADALSLGPAAAAAVVGAAVAGHGGLLWGLRDRPGQHLACLGGLITLVAGVVAWAGGGVALVGLVLWALGAAWLGASLRGVLPPAAVGTVLGGALVLVAAGLCAADWGRPGILFGLATAAALVAVGIRADRFLVTAAGVVGAFVYLPSTLGAYFSDTIGVPAVMLLSGLTLLALTATLVRRRGR
jgi:hypothetical protein